MRAGAPPFSDSSDTSSDESDDHGVNGYHPFDVVLAEDAADTEHETESDSDESEDSTSSEEVAANMIPIIDRRWLPRPNGNLFLIRNSDGMNGLSQIFTTDIADDFARYQLDDQVPKTAMLIMPYDPQAKSIEWVERGAKFDGKTISAKETGEPPKWFNNILDANGMTPMSRLNKIPQAMGLEPTFYVKLDYLNVGGSSDDRAAIRMVELAESNGLKSGMTVVAPVTGNMAVAIGLACTVKKYKCIIVADDAQQHDISTILKALGITLLRTNHVHECENESSNCNMALCIANSMKDAYFLDPNCHVGNPLAHYETTAQEIVDGLKGKVSVIAVPEGDGALATGIAQYVKDKGLPIKVIAVTATQHHLLRVPELQSVGHGSVRNAQFFSEQTACAKDSFRIARRLIREEGIMCGPATGAAFLAAVEEARALSANDNIVVVATDGIRNYLRHFIDDQWMLDHKVIKEVENKKVTPRETFDPEWLKYDPTTLSGAWEKCEGNWKKCQYQFKDYRPQRPAVIDNVLEAIGNTPLVKLNSIPKANNIEANIFVKCEFLNSGGSTKDRIAARMIELAEAEGKLKPGMTIIEPTSGNTGIGLALAAAVKGYKCIICMPVKMSKEKALAMEALGSVIVRTPNEAAFDSPHSHIGVALRLAHEIPGAIILDQYRNLGNPMAHYEQTAEEIIDALDGKIDYVFIGAGTGGTVSGIGKKLQEKVPGCQVIGVDPAGSILAEEGKIHVEKHGEGFYEVEGIGYDFLPGVLERQVVDKWMKSTDDDAFITARDLIRMEGILCGGSSGTNLHAALDYIKELNLPSDQAKKTNVVVILPDGIRNYLSKFLEDEWMHERSFPLEH